MPAHMQGDLSAPGCDLSEADLSVIRNEVDYVIHSAASISFFEHIHTLLDQNYKVLCGPGSLL
jgi:fatty acyl-CoA reductase